MTYRIAIPTYKRSNTFKEKTLAYLSKTDIDFNNIDLFLSDPSERDLYEKTLTTEKHKKINIIDGVLGVGKQRNFIVDYYPVGQNVVGIDDDISALNMKVDDKTRLPLMNLNQFLEEAFQITKEANLNIWGIYPVNNPYFMKHKISFDFKYIAAGFYGWINNHDKKAYCSDNGVVRFNYVSMNTIGYQGQGGMQVTRTKQRVKKSAEFLAKKYPQLCTLFVSKQGQYEVRLRDKRKVKI